MGSSGWNCPAAGVQRLRSRRASHAASRLTGIRHARVPGSSGTSTRRTWRDAEVQRGQGCELRTLGSPDRLLTRRVSSSRGRGNPRRIGDGDDRELPRGPRRLGRIADEAVASTWRAVSPDVLPK